MNRIFPILIVIMMVLFPVSAIAADRVVVIPLGGKKSVGDAAAADVIEGKIFSNKDAMNIPGTMADNGAVSFTPRTTDQPVPAGYHSGSGKVNGDADLVSGNIKANVTIFGVEGSQYVVDTYNDTAAATASDILTDKTAYVNGAKLTGITGLFWGCTKGNSGWQLQPCIESCIAANIVSMDDCINDCGWVEFVIGSFGPLTQTKICGGQIN